MWHLTRLSLRNRAVTIILATMLVGASVWATLQLKMEMIPDIELPITTVVTIYPEASPEEVVDEVTTPIENVVWDVGEGGNLEQLFSVTSDEISVVFAQFEFGTDMEEISSVIEQRVSELDLPDALATVPLMNPQLEENPRVIPLNLDIMMPLVFLSLSGDLPPDQLKEIADTQVATLLQSIEGVFTPVETEGSEKEQVLISPDPMDLSEYGISMSQIAGLLSLEPAYESLSGVENVALGVDSVVLGDIADVALGQAPRTVITRTNGQPSVGIVVMKEEDANTVDVANAVVEKVKEIEDALQEEYGEGLELISVFDQSQFIEDSIWELTQMALIGGILAIIIVFLFLMAFRASLVTALSIPFSILIGFLIMHFAGITVNLLTLSAMAIAVGRLIDNSIVIAEVIYRRLKHGEGFRDAAVNGSKEIAGPITASTLATVAIFLPLAFVGGIVGELFIPFALTITFALIASLAVALMVVPAFSGWFVGRSKWEEEEEARVEAGETWYQRLYTPALKWCLAHRAITVVIALVLFVGSLGLVPVIGTSFMPTMSEKMLIVLVEMPPGTDIGTTSEVAAQIEALVDDSRDEIESCLSMVGTSTSMYGALSAAMGGGDNTAEIDVFLDQGADLEQERDALDDACTLLEEQLGGDYITVETGESAMTTQMGFTGVDVQIMGESYEELALATGELFKRIQTLDGITNLESQLTMVIPKLDIQLDPAKMEALGLTEEQLQQFNQDLYLLKLGGDIPAVSVAVDRDDYGVFVRGVAAALYGADDPEALAESLKVGYPQAVALGDVAEVALVEGPTHISHIDLKLSAQITGTITEKNVGAVNREIEDEIDDVLAMPGMGGVEIVSGGVAEQMQESFSGMGIAIIAAIAIAYLILVVSMKSILNPVIIMVSLPLASIGALLALLLAGFTIGMSAMMGVLMLVGIVLTNAIVLIALVEQLRTGGMGTYDALVEGGKTRLRPILMTALTTMIAMIPLAVGATEGTLMAAELAVVVIGGLFSSTLLTLVVIPVLYSLIDSLRQRMRKAG